MILVNHYAIWPPIPRTIFTKHCRVEIMAFYFMLFHRDRFSISAVLSVIDSLLHICSDISSCHNVFILLSLSCVTTLSLLVGVCVACMLAYRCLQMKWCAAETVVAIPSQKTLLMCPYVSFSKFSLLAPRCSRALLHNLQPTSDRRLIFASHLANGMSPTLPSFLVFYVSMGRAGRSNTSLRTLSFHFAVTSSLLSMCHMQGD